MVPHAEESLPAHSDALGGEELHLFLGWLRQSFSFEPISEAALRHSHWREEICLRLSWLWLQGYSKAFLDHTQEKATPLMSLILSNLNVNCQLFNLITCSFKSHRRYL